MGGSKKRSGSENVEEIKHNMEEPEDIKPELFDMSRVVEITGERDDPNGVLQYRVKWEDRADQTWVDAIRLEGDVKIDDYKKKRAENPELFNDGDDDYVPDDDDSEEDEEEDADEPDEGEDGADVIMHIKYKKERPNDSDPEKIVGYHVLKDGTRELLVRWKGLTDAEDSWEPEHDFKGKEVHNIFLEKQRANKELAEKKKKEKEQKAISEAATNSKGRGKGKAVRGKAAAGPGRGKGRKRKHSTTEEEEEEEHLLEEIPEIKQEVEEIEE